MNIFIIFWHYFRQRRVYSVLPHPHPVKLNDNFQGEFSTNGPEHPYPIEKSPLNAASDSRKIFCLRLSFLFRQIISLNSVSRRHPSLSFYVRCNRNQQRKVPSCSLNHPPRPTKPPVKFGTRQRNSSIFWFKPYRLKYCSWRAFHSSANQQKRQRNLS